MHRRPSPVRTARFAGALYAAIIACGLTSELLIRSELIVASDPAATAANIAAATGRFRLGFVGDSVMCLCDVALAVVLYGLLRPVDRTLALLAMCFRLTQAGVLTLNLLHYHAALLLLGDGSYLESFSSQQASSMVGLFLDLHAHGYDLGLLPFGVHCVLLGWLIRRSRFLPTGLGWLMTAGGVVYLVGSYTRFLVPEHTDTVAPIYVVPLVAELALCLWLSIRGVDDARWWQVRDAARLLEQDVEESS